MNFVDQSIIGTAARHGALWNFGFFIVRQILHTGTTAVLARILYPADYGLMAMAATVTAFLTVFSDFGLSKVAVQWKDMDERRSSALFVLNCSFGLLLMLSCFLIAPFASKFYHENRLIQILPVLGISFFISGASMQPMAMLQRSMKFLQINLIQTSAGIAGSAIAIIMAINGYGVWSLVVNSLVASSLTLVLCFLLSPFTFKIPQFDSATVKMFKFGGYLVLADIGMFLLRTADNGIVGRFCGEHELGLYSVAYYLAMFPSILISAQVRNVMLPMLSSFQNDEQRFNETYYRVLILLCSLCLPVSLIFYAGIDDIVFLLYGRKWTGTSDIYFWLGLTSFSQPLFGSIGMIYFCKGKAKENAVWTGAVAILAITAFLIGIHWGVKGLACAFAIVMIAVLTVPGLFVAHKILNISIKAFGKGIMRVYAPAVPLLLAALLYVRYVPPRTDFLYALLSLSLVSVAVLVLYAGFMRVLCQADFMFVKSEITKLLLIKK